MTNTLAFCAIDLITTVKLVIVQGQCYKYFYEFLSGATLGQAPTLPSNIRLDWKGLPGTNALAYFENS